MNAEERAAYMRNYRKLNRERVAEIEKNYRTRRNADPVKGPERKLSVKQQWSRAYKTNLNFHLAHNLRTRIRLSIQRFDGTKNAASMELLGCSVAQVRVQLENNFRPGMSWDNFGSVWHIDHKRPCASFDLTKLAEQRVCFHHTNLQPLFKAENQKKGSYYRGT